MCNDQLTAAYQVDHMVPLWSGGEDTLDNCAACCANCHALKTQRENIERTAARRQAAVEEGQRQRDAFERTVRTEEERARRVTKLSNGAMRCGDCGRDYYPLFTHTCPSVRQRVGRRLLDAFGPLPEHQKDDRTPAEEVRSNRFAMYMFTGREKRNPAKS